MTFGYEEARTILSDISFRVEPGESLAIVGRSGAGKSTIANLLCRFYDVTAGAVMVGGVDIREASSQKLRAVIGVVSQDTILFHDTIQGNLQLAKPNATLGEIQKVCIAANIHEFIETLPNGYKTIVGKRGVKLSGGERQRVSIARALLRDPRILILDEATSHLDSENEHAIQEALEAIAVGRTAMVIAHRLSTVVNCDRIVVLEKGRVESIGTHSELVRREGTYRSMWELQKRSPDQVSD